MGSIGERLDDLLEKLGVQEREEARKPPAEGGAQPGEVPVQRGWSWQNVALVVGGGALVLAVVVWFLRR